MYENLLFYTTPMWDVRKASAPTAPNLGLVSSEPAGREIPLGASHGQMAAEVDAALYLVVTASGAVVSDDPSSRSAKSTETLVTLPAGAGPLTLRYVANIAGGTAWERGRAIKIDLASGQFYGTPVTGSIADRSQILCVAPFDVPVDRAVWGIVKGYAVVEAGGSFSANDPLTIDTSGRFVAGTLGTHIIYGYARANSTGSGQFVAAQLMLDGVP